MDKPKERQTAIINETDALTIAATKIKGPKKQGVKQGFTLPTKKAGIMKSTKSSTAPKKPANTKPENGTNLIPDPSSSLKNQRFYSAPGLRIPLYDARGKRLTHARDGRVIVHKISRGRVLEEYVRKYAGDAKVQEMEGKVQGKQKWSKDQIGDWITEVETRAFGQGPRGKTMKEKKEESHKKENGFQKQTNGPIQGAPMPKGKGTRSMSEEMRILLAVEDEVALPAVSKKRPAQMTDTHVSKAPPKVDAGSRGVIVTTNVDVKGKRKIPAQESQATNKKVKLDRTNVPLPSSSTAKPPATTIPPPRLTEEHPSTLAPSTSITTAPTDRNPVTTSPSTSQVTKTPLRKPKQAPPPDSFPWNHADKDLYLMKIPNLHKVETHPFLSAFSIDPTFKPAPDRPPLTTPIRTLPLPASREHLIVSAHTSHLTTSTTVLATLLPQRDVENQRAAALAGKKIAPPHRRKKNMTTPFLKPGRHGWDYEAHRWGFEGDVDLETGVGHRVDPGDEERLRKGEMSWVEFGEKYPGERGGRGGMWPCGCVIPGEEGESEEE